MQIYLLMYILICYELGHIFDLKCHLCPYFFVILHHDMRNMPQIRFAIIESNILACLGLQRLLCELLPMAEVCVYSGLSELPAEEQFLHYFVSSRIYFENATFFREHPRKTIVLVNGDMCINDVYTLNVCQGEKNLVRDIMSLQNVGHGHALSMARQSAQEALLSPREVEVAMLLCKGFINKEIADRLGVGITTIITHRKNIMDKLHARSLADVIIYCVVNGIVNIEELV